MKKAKKILGTGSAALLALALMPTLAPAQDYSDVKSNGPLQLGGYGSFYISGMPISVDAASQASNPGFNQPGDMIDGQMWVQFMKPQSQGGKKFLPIVFTHGGTLSLKTFQTTPDGRMGWDEYFVRQGFDTYLIDQVSRARSGFNGTKFNQVKNGAAAPSDQPTIFIGTDQHAWNNLLRTPCTASPCYATATPRPGVQFPMETVGVGNNGANLSLLNQRVPDMNGTIPGTPTGCAGSSCDPADPSAFAATPAQLAALAKKLGGAILLGHSQGSGMQARAALQPAAGCYPFTTKQACKVKAIIGLETGCVANLTDAHINALAKIPILFVYGDYSPVPQPAPPCPDMIARLKAAGGDVTFAELPKLTAGSLYRGSPGPIFGNTHMMMQDKNSRQVADVLIGWISSRGLYADNSGGGNGGGNNGGGNNGGGNNGGGGHGNGGHGDDGHGGGGKGGGGKDSGCNKKRC